MAEECYVGIAGEQAKAADRRPFSGVWIKRMQEGPMPAPKLAPARIAMAPYAAGMTALGFLESALWPSQSSQPTPRRQQYPSGLFQEACHNFGLGLLIAQSQGTQLQNLLARDFADGSLVD